MKHIINYLLFYALTLSILVFLMIPMNSSSMLLVSQNSVYATTQQQEDLSSPENSEGSSEGNEETDDSQEDAGDSKQTEGSKDNESNNDSSSSDQGNTCPDTDTNDIANVATYIGQDGCIYPCTSSDGQSNIPQGCPVKTSSQVTSGFSINEERPIQSQQQSGQPPQQNLGNNPGQNTFISPRINSDSATSTIPNTETTTLKSFNPAGQYKPGSGQADVSIPGSTSTSGGEYSPGAGNIELEGIGEDNISKRYDPAGPYSPEISQTELSTPEKSNDLVVPYSPGDGNAERKGSLLDRDSFDPAGPLIPGLNQTEVELPRLSRCANDITGKWVGNDGGTYFIRQIGNEVWWFGSNIFAGNTQSNAFSNVFHGTKSGLSVSGNWQDVPLGNIDSKGRISLTLDSFGEKIILKSATGGFGGTEWTKSCPKVLGKPQFPITTDVMR